jgi:hypothetical protein
MSAVAQGWRERTARAEIARRRMADLQPAPSGAGGLVLSALLLRSRLVAGWLAVLGIVGYAALLLGVVSEVLGLADLDSGAGVAFFVPGGLFELVLPLLLIAKGFATARVPGAHAVSRGAQG